MRSFMRAAALGCLLLSFSTVGALAQAEPVAVVVPAVPSTVVAVGDTIGTVIYTLLMAFATVAAGFVIRILSVVGTGIGISVADAHKAQLQQIIVNGIHWGAEQIKDRMRGKLPIDVKSELLKQVIAYVNLHGMDLLKTMGTPPGTAQANTAIEARMEKALNDPATPTPPAVTPPPPKEAVVTVLAPAKA